MTSSRGSCNNAVRDANGVRALAQRLGFEEPIAPLLDERATSAAIMELVTDDLLTLSPDDSLIVFFAGHGSIRTLPVGGAEVTTGYLIPADGHGERVSNWIELNAWLRYIASLPARHILVILDACYSGSALSLPIRWSRSAGDPARLPFAALHARHSRRLITSALGDEAALDSGPILGHSLFTGSSCHVTLTSSWRSTSTATSRLSERCARLRMACATD